MVCEKLFWNDAYLKENIAKVVSIVEEDEYFVVCLDKTCFYAFSGGQNSDEGTIDNIKVEKAVIDKDNNFEIYYYLSSKPSFKVGDEVKVEIDWENRYNLMKLHTAQHLVADFIEKEFNLTDILGGRITSQKATLTYGYEENISQILPQIEEKINNFIKENHKILRFFDKEKENFLIFECDEFSCPCGGTHVRETLEIGQIQLKRKNGGKGKEEIGIFLV